MAPERCPDTRSPFGGSSLQLPCIGVSDARAFGVCVFNGADCDHIWRMFGAVGVAVYLDTCTAEYGAPCACMQLTAGPEAPLSYFVNADTCVRYRAEYPGSVECLDAARAPLP